MSVYRFGEPTVIDEIIIRKSPGGGARAFLFANPDISTDEINNVRQALTAQNWQSVATVLDGLPCLEVRGTGKIEALEAALRPNKLISGNAVLVGNDPRDKFTVRQKFRSNMLWVYGIMNIAADIGLFGYGLLKRKLTGKTEGFYDAASSVAYLAGSTSFFAFGKGDKSDHHVSDIALKLRGEFMDRGLTLPEEVTAAVTLGNQGLGNRTKNFFRRHPAEIGNSFTALAGGLIATGALKHPTDRQAMINDTILGATTAVSGLTAALIKEEAPVPGAPPAEGLGKVKRWVKAHPNSIAGGGYMISTFWHGYESIRNIIDARKNHRDHPILARSAYSLRAGFAGLNVIAEVILAFASKGNGNGVKTDRSVDDTAYAIVADAIARQPQEKHTGLIADLSRNFLARPDVLGGDPAAIETALRERVATFDNNPWARGRMQKQGIFPEASAAPKINWQEQMEKRSQTAGLTAPALA